MFMSEGPLDAKLFQRDNFWVVKHSKSFSLLWPSALVPGETDFQITRMCDCFYLRSKKKLLKAWTEQRKRNSKVDMGHIRVFASLSWNTPLPKATCWFHQPAPLHLHGPPQVVSTFRLALSGFDLCSSLVLSIIHLPWVGKYLLITVWHWSPFTKFPSELLKSPVSSLNLRWHADTSWLIVTALLFCRAASRLCLLMWEGDVFIGGTDMFCVSVRHGGPLLWPGCILQCMCLQYVSDATGDSALLE